ncbi:MAG: toll/interleukin-1 receptor domain-containing protein [Oscillospiraceae bacterium]|nr:toll/interleukin-1 receptor domain-containing protein [Oscillospiraceae bacterium]
MSFRYDVFISYRHRPLDGVITEKVFNALESYKLPRAVKACGYEDIKRAFRDTEELQVSRILTETIDSALDSTNCMVVVCSPDAPLSAWVDREVANFIERGRAEHIYPLLIAGDPDISFPPSLKLVPNVMDRVMDIRVPGNDVKKMMAKAETELLKVVSGITGCPEAELLREHNLRRNRRSAARAIAAAATFAVIAGVSLGLMRVAQSYRETASRQEAASMRILNELTYSLPDHLTNVPGAYSRIAGILRQNTADINAILALSSDEESAQLEAAANYEKLANAGSVLGMYEDAIAAEDEAVARYEALVVGGSSDASRKLASALNNRGNLLKSAGRYAEAAEAYAAAIAGYRLKDGGDALTLAEMLGNAGANAVSLGDDLRAKEYFVRCLALLDDIGDRSDALDAAAITNYNYGVLLYREGSYTAAEERLNASCALYDRLLDITDSLQNRASYVRTASVLAACLADQGQYDRAEDVFSPAANIAAELASDGENTDYQRLYAELINNRAINFNIQSDYARADGLYADAAEIYSALSQKTGTAADQALYALALLNRGENAFKAQDYGHSRVYFEDGLDSYSSVLDGLGDYDTAQYYAWLSYYDLLYRRDFEAAVDAGLAGYELQPNNVLVNLNLGYACLYAGYHEEADALLTMIAGLGEGQAETVRLDLAAQQAAGLYSDYTAVILDKIG